MDWQKGMNGAVEYIEDNLTGIVDIAAAARIAGCSVWEFQRMFSFLAHIAVGEYVRRRRLSLAAGDIGSGGDKIIDIALKYGYESHAAFSRAFSQVFGVTPSSVRNGGIALKTYPRLAFDSIQNGWLGKMSRYSERGYVVRENGPVYFTRDMDATLKWFQDVLGWYGDIVERDDKGTGVYGCVFDYPGEVAVAHITPFRGFHLFTGEPAKGVAGFMMVDGLDALHRLVKSGGWKKITDITEAAWGARECAVTTIDGCVLRFFEERR